MTLAAAHHTQLMAAYAAGALDPALALLIDTRAALRPEAARDLARADATAGAFLEAETPAPLGREALERTLAKIAATPQATAPMAQERAVRFADELAALPEAVRALALDAARTRGWRFAGRGLRSLTLETGGAAIAEILRIAPGAAAPRHTHAGSEYTLVLRGAFHDQRGRYGVGDIAVADAAVTHQPTAEPDEVCYSLAVTDAPLRFTGALGKLSQIWRH